MVYLLDGVHTEINKRDGAVLKGRDQRTSALTLCHMNVVLDIIKPLDINFTSIEQAKM